MFYQKVKSKLLPDYFQKSYSSSSVSASQDFPTVQATLPNVGNTNSNTNTSNTNTNSNTATSNRYCHCIGVRDLNEVNFGYLTLTLKMTFGLKSNFWLEVNLQNSRQQSALSERFTRCRWLPPSTQLFSSKKLVNSPPSMEFDAIRVLQHTGILVCNSLQPKCADMMKSVHCGPCFHPLLLF